MTKSNLGTFVLECTNHFRERPAFILKDAAGSRRPLSYFEFNETVARLAQIFRNKYPATGFKIGLWGENRVEWCALALAIWQAGGVLVPLMHVATDTEVANIIQAARLDALFISPKLQKTGNYGVREVLSMDFSQSRGGGWRSVGDLLGELRISNPHFSPKQINEPRTKAEDMAVLIFTSGTTGHPKGVMLSHQNIITNILDTLDVIPTRQSDRAVSVLPLSHMFELVAGFLICHLKGICISYPESLKPEDVLSEMRSQRATFLVAVPLFFEIIDRAIQEQMSRLAPWQKNLLNKTGNAAKKFPAIGKIVYKRVHQIFGGHIRFFATGGAKIDPDIVERFRAFGIQVLQGYGLTETSPIISFTSPASHRYGTVGKVVASLNLKIDQPDEKGEGEICVKGPSVFTGYFENPEATAQVIRDGWFHTGDVGRRDGEGFLYITGRKKDMIVTPNGKNVYPEELEEILKASPLFQEVAVIGINKGRGEEVHAVVVPSGKAPREPSAQREVIWKEIERLCRDLSDYKRIQAFTLSHEELPKTATKKVRKHLLRDMVTSGRLGQSPGAAAGGPHTPLSMEFEREVWLNEKLQQITKRNDIWKEAHLRHDLGIDSLTFMEIISSLETHWGVHINDDDFGQIQTVDDLLSKNAQGSPSASPVPETHRPFNYRTNNRWIMNLMRILVHALVLRPCLKLFFRFKIHNRQFLRKNRNFVLTPNHSSHLDLLTVLSAVPLGDVNSTYAVAADDYFFNHPAKAFFVRLLFNAIPFQRRARIDKGFQVCEEILRDGGNLVIFPEGTRSTTGQMASFKPGVGRLLASQGYTAVPVYIKGAYDAFPKGAALPRFKPVALFLGEPKKFLSAQATLDGYQNVALTLQSSVEKLRDQAKLQSLRP